MYASKQQELKNLKEKEDYDYLKLAKQQREEMEQLEEDMRMNAESLILQNNVLIELAPYKLPIETLQSCRDINSLLQYKDMIFEDAKNHKCDSNCQTRKMRKDEEIVHPTMRTVHKATGSIYVCTSTGLIHKCGTMCNAGIIATRSEGIICCITGLVLENIISRSEWSKPRDHRHISKNLEKDSDTVSFSFCNDENVVDIPIDMYNDCNYVNDFHRQRMLAKRKTPRRVRLSENQIIKKMKNNNNNSFFSSREEFENNKEKKKRKPRISNPANKHKSEKNRIHAIVSDFLYPSNKLRILKNSLKTRDRHIETEIKDYYNRVVQEEKNVPIFTEIVAIVSSNMLLYEDMSGISCDQKAKNLNCIDYYTRCLMQLWDIVSCSEFAQEQSIGFEQTIISLLYYMKDGYDVEVKHDIYNRLINEEEEQEEEDISKTKIIFIDKHTELNSLLLPLRCVSSIKKVNTKCSRKKSDTNYDSPSVMHGQLNIICCYKSIVESLCINSSNINALKKYMLSTYIKNPAQT